jgi:hypothetical protein
MIASHMGRVAGALCLIFAVSSTLAQETWQNMTGPDKSFTAELPAAPRYTATRLKTASGSPYTQHQYLLEEENRAFIVQSTVYPNDVDVTKPHATLQNGLDIAAKRMEGGKWASLDWLQHDGLTAADAVGVREGQEIRSYSVIKGRQVITLLHVGAPGSARGPDVDRFVKSLKVSQ